MIIRRKSIITERVDKQKYIALFQDSTFVTRVHPFTNEVHVMKEWLSHCTAEGGGDGPEAVADAMNDTLHLSWRSNATKVCILISDAPPHGLKQCADGFPDGCPLGHDPLKIARQMADVGITLYVAGVEPPIGMGVRRVLFS